MMEAFGKPWPIVVVILIGFISTIVQGRLSGGRKQASRTSPDETSAERLEKFMNTTNFKLLVPTPGNPHHPLDPLSASEIRLTALIIRAYDRNLKLSFQCTGLHEPEKALLISSYLTGVNPSPGSVERKSCSLVVDRTTQAPYLVLVNLSTHKVERFDPAGADQHSPFVTSDDQDVATSVVLSNKDVVRRLSDLGFNDLSKIHTDVWEGGYVSDNPNYSEPRNLVQVFLYAVLGNGDNFYAHPIDFVVYVDVGAQIVKGIENLPIHDGFDTSDRSGNSVPLKTANFYPELLSPNTIRKDVQPISISRPQGTSFQINDRQVTWQNFKFHVGFNPREGAIINQVTYNDNGNLRPLFYRLALSDVYLYYGDPRPPMHRKDSFDEGNYEFGHSLVSLSGEFCRGQPHYFDAVVHDERAETSTIKNAICVVEEPDSILWAFYDSNSDRTSVKQSQRLAVNVLAGIGNANYLISWRFYQDATIEMSLRLTGLVSPNLVSPEVKSPLYGNIMMSQVYTQNFQFFIGAKVDADIDGVQNTVSMEDVVSPSNRIDLRTNPYGNGIVTKSTVLKTAADGATDNAQGRYWRISNPSQSNSINGKPTSYKLIPKGPLMPNLLSSNSPLRDRVPWANHNMWVLPFNDYQTFIDTIYLDSGVSKWTNENPTANIENTDVVLWPVVSFVHTPDIENWPIITGLPEMGFQLRPSNFFIQNPALTVPPANETTAFDDTTGNQSVHGWGSGKR